MAGAADSLIVHCKGSQAGAESGAGVIEKNKERWRELCERASIEQDPQKMLELVKEINEVLAEKLARLEDSHNETN